MTSRVRWFLFVAAALVTAYPASAYYHFLHYSGDPSNPTVIPEKFYLAQLPSNTVTFYVSDAGPTKYEGADSFPSVVNQIRQATTIWNGVNTSALRVAFGGLYTQDAQDNSPGGDVVFEDLTPLPPGTLAYSGPTTRESDVATDTETFRPILRSTMHLSRDLTIMPAPSFSETFYLVAVHEMGHALGLQHTFASGAMSTIATRATSLLHPIAADDIAGISSLYPTASFAAQTGTITGKVIYSDNQSGVHMASVMAIRSGAPAVSALTLPDGSYKIEGIPPGQYFVYAQPLAPTADITAPTLADGTKILPGRPFNAVLYPGTRDLLSATAVGVVGGKITTGADFTVTPRADVPIYDVSLYSYFYPDGPFNNATAIAVHPAYVNLSSGPASVVASGTGITANGALAPGMNIHIFGGAADLYATQAYTPDSNTYLALYLQSTPFGQTGTQHLLFSTPDYLYILPSALNVVSAAPAYLSNVAPNGDGTINITASGLTPTTQIYFDALPAAINTLDLKNGIANVTPPQGASSQTATVAAYNTDGQNSMFLQLNSPVTYTYGSIPSQTLSISPSTMPAGVEGAVDITGTGTSFAQGATVFGFGTHDIVVRRVFVLSPTHAIADLYIPSGAAQITTQVTALTGFQVATLSQAFQITSPQAGIPSAAPILFNAVAGQSGIYPGAVLTVYGTNLLSSSAATPVLKFNGKTATILYASPTQINFQLPLGLAAGTAVMALNNGAVDGFPVVVLIDPPQPVLLSAALAATNAALDNITAAHPGDAILVLVSGLAPAGTKVDPSRVQVSVGGVLHNATAVSVVDPNGVCGVQFTLSANVAPGVSVPVIVYIDGRSSSQGAIMVSAP